MPVGFEKHGFSEVIPHTASIEEIRARQPVALVLSGGPASVYADGAPKLDPALLDLGVPVLGICYGFQAMAQALGGSSPTPALANTVGLN